MRIIFKLELKGDSIHNGKQYKICHWTVASYSRAPGPYDNNVKPDSIINFSSGLLREDNGRVWMVNGEENRLVNSFGKKDVEVLIYDMNLNIGDSIQIGNNSLWRDPEFIGDAQYNPLTYGKYIVDNVEFKEIYGVVRKIQYFKLDTKKIFLEYYNWEYEREHYMPVIEGVGNQKYCLFMYPFSFNMYSLGNFEPYLRYMASENGKNIKVGQSLLSVKDIYKNPVKVYTTNSGIIIEGEYSHWSVTDISGRRWNTLKVPAGLYIVNVDGIPHKVMVK